MYPLPPYAGFIWFRLSLEAPAFVARMRFNTAKWLAWHLRAA
jgi:hypothetical protein